MYSRVSEGVHPAEADGSRGGDLQRGGENLRAVRGGARASAAAGAEAAPHRCVKPARAGELARSCATAVRHAGVRADSLSQHGRESQGHFRCHPQLSPPFGVRPAPLGYAFTVKM